MVKKLLSAVVTLLMVLALSCNAAAANSADDYTGVNPFIDVHSGAWYYDDVCYVYQCGIMNGVTDTLFAPSAPMSRAMFITMIYRYAGSPPASGKVSDLFTDCPDNMWYSNAIAWAAQVGIATGVSTLKFEPNSDLTRQEMAVFLYRYIQSTGGGFKGDWMFLLDYSDRGEIASWAYEAVAYCSSNNLITGIEANTFAPTSLASRAMGAAVMHRFDSAKSAQQEIFKESICL